MVLLFDRNIQRKKTPGRVERHNRGGTCCTPPPKHSRAYSTYLGLYTRTRRRYQNLELRNTLEIRIWKFRDKKTQNIPIRQTSVKTHPNSAHFSSVLVTLTPYKLIRTRQKVTKRSIDTRRERVRETSKHAHKRRQKLHCYFPLTYGGRVGESARLADTFGPLLVSRFTCEKR